MRLNALKSGSPFRHERTPSQVSVYRAAFPTGAGAGKPPCSIFKDGTILWTYDLGHQVLSISSGLGLGRVDLDTALEMGAILDANPRRGNVAGDRAIRLHVDAVARMDIADDLAVDDDFAGVNLGI